MAASQDRRRHPRRAAIVTDAALRALLLDCLKLWEVKGRIAAVSPHGLAIETAAGAFVVRQAEEAIRPVRWFMLTPERQAAGRAPSPRSSPCCRHFATPWRAPAGPGCGSARTRARRV